MRRNKGEGELLLLLPGVPNEGGVEKEGGVEGTSFSLPPSFL
jgi:hypothetical protein